MSIFRSRPARRRALLAAAVAAAVAAGAGVVSGMSPATARQDSAQAAFRCALPGAGQVDTPVEVGLTVPETVVAGQELAAEPTVAITLPATAVDALRAAAAETLAGTATADLVLRQGGVDTPLAPAELAADPLALPAAGDLLLTLTGPAVTAKPVAGQAELVLTGLSARLRAGAAGKADQALDCGAYAGGDTLGSVAVTAAPVEPKAAPVAPMAPAAPGLKTYFYVDGSTRVAKIGADIEIGRGELVVNMEIAAPGPDGRVPMTGELTLPNTKAYLVVFRFMPVRNTIVFEPGPLGGTARLDLAPPKPKANVDSAIGIILRLTDVSQDGVPLNVGSKCRTVRPLDVRIKGDVFLVKGETSTFDNVVVIPPFTGCGVSEDLDPLITGLVSGPGNNLRTRLTFRCIDVCAPGE